MAVCAAGFGMYKYNSKLVVEGKEVSIKQLRKHGTKAKRSRSMNLYYHQYIAEIDGVKVNVFIAKLIFTAILYHF